jgi:hypothetical protein
MHINPSGPTDPHKIPALPIAPSSSSADFKKIDAKLGEWVQGYEQLLKVLEKNHTESTKLKNEFKKLTSELNLLRKEIKNAPLSIKERSILETFIDSSDACLKGLAEERHL